MKRRGKYRALFTDPNGDSCFSVYQIIWINMKKKTFYKLKTSIIMNFCTIYKHFGDFVNFCCKFSMKISFFLPVYTDKPKFVAFLVFLCTTASYIETRRHLGSGRKTRTSQGYFELRELIKTRENCYSLIW